MRLAALMLLAPILFIAACAPRGAARVSSGPPATIAPGPSAAAPAPDPGQEAFEARILPFLADKCSPCHFPGGKMYARLPFDRPGTIRVLGTALFTRIHDEEERQAIRDFIGVRGDANPAEEVPE